MRTGSSVRFILFGLVLILSSLQNTQAQQVKKYNSLLWRISGNGLKEPSFLYGTMHVSKKVAYHLTDSFFIALDKCDHIALELNPDKWLDQMFSSELFMMALSLSPSNSYEGGNFYETAFKLALPRDEVIAASLAEDPGLVNQLLFRFEEGSINYEENTFLDLFIFQSASKMHKQVASLEDFDHMFLMLTKAMMRTNEDGADHGRFTAERRQELLKSGLSVDELTEKAYRNGDLDFLDSLSDLTFYSGNARKYLINERNKIMAHEMDSLMHNHTLFTGVGALHLPGDSGVIELLRRKGYTVTPVFSKTSKSSAKKYESLEAEYLPVKYRTQFCADSAFSVSVPNSLHELPASISSGYDILSADMVNGVYYTVSRFQTFGALVGKSREEVLSTIDSMLYENVPGKISSTKKINSNSDYPGIDIISKTRRGDMLHYQIFVSKTEIFVFKAGGNGTLALSKDGESFFNSIHFTDHRNQTSQIVSPSWGEFSVKMPSSYSCNESPPDLASHKQGHSPRHVTMQAIDEITGSYYMVLGSSLHDFEYIEEDTFELSRLAEEFAKQFEFKVSDRQFITQQKLPAISFTVKNNKSESLAGRILMHGPYYYLLCTNANAAAAGEFFSSFTISDFHYNKPFDAYHDTTLKFIVKAPTLNQDMERYKVLFNDVRNQYENIYDKDGTDYSPSYKQDDYVSSSSPEIIHVEKRRSFLFHTVHSEEDYWKGELDDLTYRYGLIVKKKSIFVRDSIPMMSAMLTDTNSSRALKILMMVKGRSTYTLTSVVDTLIPLSKWTNDFYNTFTPADSMPGNSIFRSQTNEFFQYLNSDDTTKQKDAMFSAQQIKFKPGDAASLITYLNGNRFKSADADRRSTFISNLGEVKSKDFLAQLRKMYVEAKDTADLQFAILEALAKQHDVAASKLFMELMRMETPLSSSNYDVYGIFSPFYDSLETAVVLFPELFDYTSFEEYKAAIYDLMASLVWKNMLKPSVYADKKINLIAETSAELKRAVNSGRTGSNKYDYYEEDYERFGSLEREWIGGLGKYYYSNDQGDTDDNFIVHRWGNPMFSCPILLLPFYDEQNVKSVFEKILKSNDDELTLYAAFLLLIKGKREDTAVFKKYLEKDEYRIFVYNELKKLHRGDLIDASIENPLSLSKGYVFANNDYEGDSIQFVEKKFVKNRFGSGNVYFFRFKKESKYDRADSKRWQLAYTGFQPEDSAKFTSELRFFSLGSEYEEGELNEAIDDAIKEIEVAGRQRLKSTFDYGSGYNYDEDY